MHRGIVPSQSYVKRINGLLQLWSRFEPRSHIGVLRPALMRLELDVASSIDVKAQRWKALEQSNEFVLTPHRYPRFWISTRGEMGFQKRHGPEFLPPRQVNSGANENICAMFIYARLYARA